MIRAFDHKLIQQALSELTHEELLIFSVGLSISLTEVVLALGTPFIMPVGMEDDDAKLACEISNRIHKRIKELQSQRN